MARPRFDGVIRSYRFTLRLREGEDDDLINWLDSLNERGRAQAVIQSLRNGGLILAQEEPVDEDAELYASLDGMMM